MTVPQLALLTLGMAVLTYLLRVSFFLLQEKWALPDQVRRTLRYAPTAVLLGLVAPAVTLVRGQLDLSPGNDRFLAAATAFLISWFTRSTLLTILGGMATLWVLQILGS